MVKKFRKKPIKSLMFAALVTTVFTHIGLKYSAVAYASSTPETALISVTDPDIFRDDKGKELRAGRNKLRLINGEEINIIIPQEFKDTFTQENVKDIISDNNLKGGETITIHNVIVTETEPITESNEGRIIYNYSTSITYTGTEKALSNDYFIISVAKGATKKLTSNFSQTVTTKIDVGTGKDSPFQLSGGLESKATYSQTKERTFSGPPEGGKANSREYRVKFYGRTFNWTQTRTTILTGTRVTNKGTGLQPTKALEYSIDHSI